MNKEIEALETGVGLKRIEDCVALAITGDDAQTWLNGQVTQNILRIDPKQAAYAFVLNVQGRILSDAWIFAHEHDLKMFLPTATFDEVFGTLEKHIIMEDVTLERDNEMRLVSLQGPKAKEVLSRIPQSLHAFRCNRLGIEGYDLTGTHTDVEAVYPALVQTVQSYGGSEISEATWEVARIAWGRPKFGVDFGTKSYPQETGLNELAVSFDKGCYVGQETVVMIEHRGQAPRTLYAMDLESEVAPAEGTPIVREDRAEVGTVTSATIDPVHPHRVLAIGSLRRGTDPQSSLFIGTYRITPRHKIGSKKQ